MPQIDACTLLDEDHKKVEGLFADYQAAGDDDRKLDIAQIICQELTIHAAVEEEIFYPAFLKAVGDKDMIDEAQQEHQEAKDLIAEIEASDEPDALIATLQKAIDHHVKEERQEMFPKARKAKGLDLIALATKIETRKVELQDQYHAAGH